MECLAYCVSRSSACRYNGKARTLRLIFYCNVAGSNIADHHRDKERRNILSVIEVKALLVESMDSAYTGADITAQTLGLNLALDAAVLHCLSCRCHCILAEKIHSAALSFVYILCGIEILNLSSNLSLSLGRVEMRNDIDAAFTAFHSFPHCRSVISDRRNSSYACNYNSFHLCLFLSVGS